MALWFDFIFSSPPVTCYITSLCGSWIYFQWSHTMWTWTSFAKDGKTPCMINCTCKKWFWTQDYSLVLQPPFFCFSHLRLIYFHFFFYFHIIFVYKNYYTTIIPFNVWLCFILWIFRSNWLCLMFNISYVGWLVVGPVV